VDLALNNDRNWFQPRRAEYERLLRQPLEAMIAALAVELGKRRVPLLADPKKSPFRIYRDTRFSKDKSPYKSNIAASFPWVGRGAATSEGESERHGGGYFHLSPEGTYMGGGMWHPEPARLAAFRRAVDTDTVRTLEALNEPGFVKRFEHISSDGESLKRVPHGYAPDHPQADLLKMKNVTFGRELTQKETFSKDLPKILAEDFAAAVPVMRFLASLEVE
jgi:uncharacterized protein (TIGR02453 family)